jgi:putative DNA primase/helicase
MRHETPLLDRARGRWHGILPALGIPAKLLDTRRHQPCPFCGGKDRFRYTDKDGDGRFICNPNGSGCGTGTGIDFVMRFHQWDFAKAAREIETVIGDISVKVPKAKGTDPEARTAMQNLWDACSLIKPGDFVDRYLGSRGIRQDRFSSALRKIESTKHETEGGLKSWHPAMVAKITAPDGKPTNLHRTYLTLSGAKAVVDPVRKTMWGSIAKGSAIRLFPPEPVMGIAEGIETALAAAELFRIPVWAAINSTILTGWEPPPETVQVIIFGDNDPKFGGQAAANSLAHRLACQRNIRVSVEIPSSTGDDWNDVLIARRGLAA